MASAHANQWDFTFHNLHSTFTDEMTGEFIDYGRRSVSGYFIATDDNQDGVIGAPEIDLLMFGVGGDPFNEVYEFTYSGGNQLTFRASAYRAYLDTTSGYYSGSAGSTYRLSLDASSFITVSPASVPEAASSVLLLAGLLGLSGVRFARSRKRPDVFSIGTNASGSTY